MLDKAVFGEINIGPPPRVQTQQQSTPAPEQTTPPQPAPTQSTPTQPVSSLPAADDITSTKHPGNLRFQQALNAIEHSPNIPYGTFTGERLQQSAANLAYASLAGEERAGIGGRNESLSRIDFAVFNKDRSGLIAGEGDIGNPSAKLTFLSGAQDNNRSLIDTSRDIHGLLQDPQKLAMATPVTHHVIAQEGVEPEPAGPRR
jgi:hypothetical protein